MKNIKKYVKKIIEILSLKELRILPAYLAYSFVLASIPLFTIIVIVAGRFNISIDTVINLMNDVLPGYVSTTITNVISGKNYDLSIGFLNLITFFLAIKGTYSIINASNSLYKIDKTSPVKDILKSVLILCIIIGILLFLIISYSIGFYAYMIAKVLSPLNLTYVMLTMFVMMVSILSFIELDNPVSSQLP